MIMDLFVKHLVKIKKIAQNIAARHGFYYEVDELINAAYLKYDRAITNNPALIEEQFSKVTTFCYRVQMDMKDYIIDESKYRTKKRLADKDLPVPSFQSMSVTNSEGDAFDVDYYVQCHSHEEGYIQFENKDYLDELCKSAPLSDDEWAIIQGYFYDEKSLKEIGQEIGYAEGTICTKKQKLLKKLLTCSGKLL
jgi:RNA polymerase sigma factor (sigma-70 family)